MVLHFCFSINYLLYYKISVLTDFLIQLGYGGMFIAAFLAGSVFPFSSETLLAALLLTPASPWILFVMATVGNVLGSMFNYYIGSHFRIERIEKIMRIKKAKIEQTKRFLDRHSFWMGVLSIVPFVGSAVTVTLGYTHARFWLSMANITIAKALRYWLIIFVFDLLVEPSGTILPTSCNTEFTNAQQTNAGELRIMVSIPPLAWAARNVYPEAEISVLCPKGGNPEIYEPTPQQMISLAESNIFFHTGNLGMEQQWLERLKKNAPQTKFVKVGNSRKGGDPHCWTSPSGMQHILDDMVSAVDCQRDSSFIIYYDKLRQSCAEGITPRRGTAFAIFHPSLTAYAAEYGLKQIAIEQHGKEPSPSDLPHIIDECRRHNVKVILVQEEFDQRMAETIAKQLGIRTARINPLSENWKEEITHTTKIINEL